MSHISLEYSANREGRLNIQDLWEHLRTEAAGIETFPMPGVRVRAFRAEHFSIADGDPKHAFIDMSVRMRAGRPMDIKQDAAGRHLNAQKAFLEPVLKTTSLALPLEMRDIDPDLSPKTGTIRDHLGTA